MSTLSPALRTLPHTAGFSDGFGDRQLVFDPAAGTSLEVLTFKPEFAESPEFEAAILARIEALTHVQHASLANIHSVERNGDQALSLVSKHTPGRRVSDLLPRAHGPAFALELIRLVTPALAALHRAGDDVAHGALSPERIVVTRDGRLVVVESALGAAIESMNLSRERLNELGLVVPEGTDPVQFTPRTDLAQLGYIALALLLGRRLVPADYPDKVPALLDEYALTAGSPIVTGKLRTWLERAMQISPRSFATARDAQAAFSELPDDVELQASAMEAFPVEERPAPAAPARVEQPPTPAPTSRDREAHASAAASALKKTKKRGGNATTRVAGIGAVVVLVGGGAAYFLTAQLRSATDTSIPHTPAVNAAAPVSTAALTTTLAPTPTPTPLATPPPVSSPVTTPVAAASSTPAPTPKADPAGQASTAAAGATPSQTPAAAAGSQRFGGVKIASQLDLQVFENGTLLGSSSTPIAISEGAHSIELVNESTGFSMRQTLNVKSGQMTNLNIAVPTAKVSINANPWADVEVDGKPAGETPLANLSLPIGPHEITFRHPQLGVRKQTIIVKVDGQTRVTQVFEK